MPSAKLPDSSGLNYQVAIDPYCPRYAGFAYNFARGSPSRQSANVLCSYNTPRSDSLAEIDPNITFLRSCRDSHFVFAGSKKVFRQPWPGEAKLNAEEDLHEMLDDCFVTYLVAKYPVLRHR